MVDGTSAPQGPQTAPADEASAGDQDQARGAGTGSAPGRQVVDNDVVIREANKMDSQLKNAETKMDTVLQAIFQDFGLAKPEEGSKLDNIFNVIFEMITKMREAMSQLKQMAVKKTSQVSVQVFNTTMNGVQEMKKHAQTAFTMAVSSAITTGVGAGVGFVGTTRAAKAGGPNMAQNAQAAQSASQLFGSGAKLFDGAGSLAQTDAQAATKDADAKAQFLQTLMQAIQELSRDLDGMLNNLDSTQQGTMSAQKPRVMA